MSQSIGKLKSNKSLECQKVLAFMFLLAMAFALSSCGAVGKYAPNPSIAKNTPSSISATAPIAVINAQSNTTERKLPLRGIVVTKQEWTQSLVQALTTVLKKNGVSVQEDAEKKLNIVVTEIDISLRGATYRGYLEAEVKTGDGKKEKFEVTRASYASGMNVSSFPTKPLDACFKDLVTEILENENIKGYIAQ